MSGERCPLTDLLVDQCGCKDHRNSAPLNAIDYADYLIDLFLVARYDGRCALDPAHAIKAGDDIGKAVLADRAPGSEWTVVGYVCSDCVKAMAR